MRYWSRPNDPGAYVVLSTNTADSIKAAQTWWTTTGSAAVIVVSIVCALAWWHQRRLREVFRDEADSLEIIKRRDTSLGSQTLTPSKFSDNGS